MRKAAGSIPASSIDKNLIILNNIFGEGQPSFRVSILEGGGSLMNGKGLFIVLEGPDGCGKTAQSRRLVAELRHRGYEVVETREPGGTAMGDRVRQILFDGATPCETKLGETFLFCADRVEHLKKIVLPAVQEGQIVICDRFSASTLAYQGYTSGEPGFLERVIQLDEIARGGVKPDLCLILWVDAQTGLERGGARRDEGGEWNEFDARTLIYHGRVSEGYQRFVRDNPLGFPRVVLIDARPDVETVFAAVQAEIEQILPTRQKGE